MPSHRHIVSAVAALVVALPLGFAQPALSAPTRQAPAESARPSGGAGSWQVAKTATDSYLVSWRSPVRLPVTSDRPTIESSGTSLGTAVVAPDGRTVSVEVHAARRPDRR